MVGKSMRGQRFSVGKIKLAREKIESDPELKHRWSIWSM